MTLWTFPVDSQGWTLQYGAVHNGAEGHAGLGCIQLANDTNAVERMIITGLSISSEHFRFYWRIRPTTTSTPEDYTFVGINFVFTDLSEEGFLSDRWYHTIADSDWMVLEADITPGKTISEVLIYYVSAGISGDGKATIFIDDVLVGPASTGYGLTHSAGGIPGSVLIVSA